MDVKSIAAIIFVAVTVGAVGFQLALAMGAPWGAYAMGGTFPGRFPAPMRVAAIVQALVLTLLAAVVIARSGLALDTWAPAASWLIWVVVAFAAVSLVLNSITSSGREARLGARRNDDAGLKFGRSTHCVIGRASHSASRWRFQQTPCLACYARSDSCTAERRS